MSSASKSDLFRGPSFAHDGGFFFWNVGPVFFCLRKARQNLDTNFIKMVPFLEMVGVFFCRNLCGLFDGGFGNRQTQGSLTALFDGSGAPASAACAKLWKPLKFDGVTSFFHGSGPGGDGLVHSSVTHSVQQGKRSIATCLSRNNHTKVQMKSGVKYFLRKLTKITKLTLE